MRGPSGLKLRGLLHRPSQLYKLLQLKEDEQTRQQENQGSHDIFSNAVDIVRGERILALLLDVIQDFGIVRQVPIHVTHDFLIPQFVQETHTHSSCKKLKSPDERNTKCVKYYVRGASLAASDDKDEEHGHRQEDNS